MRIFSATLVVFASIAMLMTAQPTSAKPLDPAKVPADAKWLIHVDFDTLRETTLAQKVREKRPEMVNKVRQWFQDRYGMDLREDLRGVTLFSDTYESHTGTIVLDADYDVDKVKERIEKDAGAEPTSWQNYTLYTVEAEEGEGKSVTIILGDGEQTVFGSSPERAKAAVKLLEGDAPSLEGKDSELLADVPEGHVAYGAAIELAKIERHDGVFPILRQHERIVWTGGERDDGTAFEHSTFVAQSEEVARQMKAALDGFVAFLNVWAADSDALTQIAEGVEISRDGATVESRWEGDSQQVLAALRDLRERAKQWRGADRYMKKKREKKEDR